MAVPDEQDRKGEKPLEDPFQDPWRKIEQVMIGIVVLAPVFFQIHLAQKGLERVGKRNDIRAGEEQHTARFENALNLSQIILRVLQMFQHMVKITAVVRSSPVSRVEKITA